jgi:hypothetical protein
MVIQIDEFFEIWVDNKKLHFSIHVRNEIDEYEKDTLFAAEIIDKGEKKLISKIESKYESHFRIGDWTWIVSYAEGEDLIIVIHLGKER